MSLLSHRLDLPYLAEAQAQKHVTINEGLRRLDALVHLSVKTSTLSAEPTSPSQSDAYILPGACTGLLWSTLAQGDVVVFQDGAWEVYPPVLGMTAYNEDKELVVAYNGTEWVSLNELKQLGVNASPDATNKLVVKSDAILMSHDDVTPGSGDVRLVLNKSGGSATASMVFQSAFSGKAEFGLTGNNDFAIKVADDQGTFRDALVIDRQTGAVSLPNTP